MREFAIVGQDDEAFAVGVQPTDRKDSRLIGYEFDDHRSTVGVVCGGDHSGRLVHEVVDEIGSDPHRRAIDLDHIVLDIDAPPEFGAFAVDRHPTGCDEFFASSARSESKGCQHLL